MKNYEGYIKGFYHLARSWYAETNLKNRFDGLKDEVMFGFYHPNGGTMGEMAMRWIELNSRNVPRFEIYSDAWYVLSQFQDLINVLAEYNDKDITPEEFCDILLGLGFEDLTCVKREKDFE